MCLQLLTNIKSIMGMMLLASSFLYASDRINEHNKIMEEIEKKESKEQKKFEGYSFFKTALQHISYEERYVYKNDHPARGISKGDVQTNDFSGTNFVTIAGNIAPLNETYDFSFETISTLVPQEINEKWTVGSRTNQTDKSSIDFTQVTFLIHQKFTPQHRAVAGLEFKKLEFERYDFRLEDGSSAFPGLTTQEQSSINIRERLSSLSLDAGYVYQSKNIGKEGWHYDVKTLVKVPFWQKAENSSAPDVSFSDPSGYDLDLELGVSYNITPNIDIGIFGGYSYIYRVGEKKNNINWPENTFTAYTLGFSFLWNL